MIANLPLQKVSLAHKMNPKNKWGERTIDEFIRATDWGANQNSMYRKYYDLYYGEPDMDVYDYVTNPYNFPAWRQFKMPAKVRNYNIIKPVVDLLIGEAIKRPFNYQVSVQNFDAPSKMKDEKIKVMRKLVEQMFVNEANELGVETGIPSKEVPTPEEAMTAFHSSYDDIRAMMGQDAIDYLKYNLELPMKFQDAFLHWCITGVVTTYKSVEYGDVYYEIVPPDELEYDRSSGTGFIEDGSWAIRKTHMSANQIMDAFFEDLTEEQIDWLENPNSTDIITTLFNPVQNDNTRRLPVYHITWKSFRKIGLLTYIDVNGQQQSMEVSEKYKLDEAHGDIDIEWFWVNQVWEGYRIDQDMYLRIQPLEFQRQSMNNPSDVKLPYNGRKYANEWDLPVSIVSLGEPFQILYNVFHFMLEKTINKNRDKIAMMDINMIPKKGGWDEDKFMYYADAFSWAFVDSTAENAQGERANFQNFQALDLSISQYIGTQFELLLAVKQEYEDMIGVTRQRKGNIAASDSVGTTERAVFQSAVTSEDMFKRFEGLRTRDMQGLVDISQVAWREGKKGTFLNSEFRNQMLDIDPEVYCHADLGIFATDSSEEMEKLQNLKGVALEFVQNGAKPSTIADILDSSNFAKVRNKLKEVEAAQEKMEQAAAEREQAATQELKQMELDNREDVQAHDEKQKDKEIEVKREEIQSKEGIEAKKLIVAREKVAIDEKSNDLQKEQIQSNERIAKSKKATV